MPPEDDFLLVSPLVRVLRWSEKYTKTNMVQLASVSIWSVIGQAITGLCSLALAFIVARYVSKVSYGEYRYILSVIAILSAGTLSGLGSAVLQSVAAGHDQSMRDAFWINIRWSAFLFVSTLAIGGYYFVHGNVALAAGIAIAGLASPFLTSANFYGAYLNGKRDFRRAVLYANGLSNIVPPLAVMAAAIFTPISPALVVAYFAGNLLSALFFYYRAMRLYPPREETHDPHLLSYSRHLSVTNVALVISNNLANVLLFHYLGAAEVSIYSFATAMLDQLKGPIGTVGNMLTAGYATRDVAEIRAGARRKMFWLTITIAAFVVIYIIAAPWIYRVFFPAYEASAFYSQIYALSLFGSVFTPAVSFITARKLIRAQYAIGIILAVFQIITMYIGVVTAGVLGAVVSRVLTRSLKGLISQYYYVRAGEA